ncbi:hypothetical protein, partial [Candidatus Caldatribacterium sp.]|uniref:hypothetical protein n=1 Tax=Candidatus Caldatribacterium sp. TaxID=2282143 RepID=UPI00384509ED|nr:hypothetical protein [Candidatus Caldatribacterium sp.]
VGKKIVFVRERRSTDEAWVMIESGKGFEKYPSREGFEKNVNRFIPKEISSFFFFDGESLNTYFRNFSKVLGKIGQLAHINILDGMKKNFEELLKEFARNTDLGADLQRIYEQIEKLRHRVNEHNKCIETLQTQKEEVEEEIDSLSEELRGQPDVRELVENRKRLEEQVKKTESRVKEKHEKRQEVLIRLAKIAYFGKALQKVLQLVKEKHRQGELPPPVSDSLLKEALQREKCPVCQRVIDRATRIAIENIVERIRRSSLLTSRMLILEQCLSSLKRSAEADMKLLRELNRDIEELNRDLKNLKNEIGEIENKLSLCDSENLKFLYRKLEEMKRTRDDIIEKLAKCKAQKENDEKTLQEKEWQYDDLLKKRERSEQRLLMYKACKKAKAVLERVEKRVLEEIREEVERATREAFFRLLWKKESFKDIRVKQDYTVEILDRDGRNCLGSLSAAERELFALSFILALHNLSGFQGPLVIDTPLARLSHEHRENFARVLLEISKHKQIILLLTPAEFSEEVSCILKPCAATIRWLQMSDDECKAFFVKES